VVFTLPRRLAPLALQNKKVIYDLLFRTCAETLLEVARDSRHLGAEIGFFSVLHTWSQKLEHHPHLHCVVPAGGLAPDHQRWIPSRYRFFLPVKVLGRVFRGKFVAALKRAFDDGQLGFYGDLKLLAKAKVFASFLRPLFRQDWVVYCKPPFGGPEHVLRYLGRYTHRVAISNHRLVSLAGSQVTFRWRDSTHGNQQRLLTLAVEEFLRRFLLHVLPPTSSASATSAFWPTDGASRSCQFASSSWDDRPTCHPPQDCRQRMRKAHPSRCLLPPHGSVPSAAVP